MISCKLAGGLGNYLFQIGAAATLANKIKTEFVVDVHDIMQVHRDYRTYTDNIFRKVKFTQPTVDYVWDEGSDFEYHEIPSVDNLKLNGHFQSEKYLERNLILDLFNVEDIIFSKMQNNKSLNQIVTKIKSSDNSVSIHVRRGDYLTLPNYHPVCSIEYFLNSIDVIGNDNMYFIFSDDYDWCKTMFPQHNLVRGFSDWIDLYLMSICKHNIIANSTFSWWGAWLNTNVDKKVVAPKQWFGQAKQLNTIDLLPMEWIQL